MTDETVDLTLQRIKRFETRLDSQGEAISEIKHRLSDLETGQAGIMSVLARMQIMIGQQLSGQKVKRLFYMFQNLLVALSHWQNADVSGYKRLRYIRRQNAELVPLFGNAHGKSIQF